MRRQWQSRKPRNKHDQIVSWLANRLIDTYSHKKGRFSLETLISYHSRGKSGEVDLLFHNEQDWYHFYEVKSTDTRRGYKKAQEQFERFCAAYPKRKTKGVYVTPKKVCRLYNYRP